MGKKLGSNLGDWLWFRVSHETAVMVLAGLQSSESLTGAEGSASKMAHMVDKLMLAIGRRPQSLTTWTCS